MIAFPNAKINLGLYITEKRPDGFHELETVMVPIPLTDALEFVESDHAKFEISGIEIEGDQQNNLVLKAYHLLKDKYKLPSLQIHLLKKIPFGAGLGGGSSDAAFMLKMLNDYFSLNLLDEELEKYAAELGSDCPFFIGNKPVLAKGRGEIMEEISLNLSGYYLLLIKPPFEISTREAYSNITPAKMRISLKALVDFSIQSWKENIKNQFEKTIFPAYPELEEIKRILYDCGAIYASMSGSGSAMYGLFRIDPKRFTNRFPSECFSFSVRL